MACFIGARAHTAHWIGWAFACAIALCLGACGGGSDGPGGGIVPPPFASPTITMQPSGQSAVEGNSATFSVTATTSGSPLAFQWMRGGASITGANSSMLVLSNVQLSDDASMYSVRVSNATGTIVSNTALLTVQPRSQAGTISAFAGTIATTFPGVGATLSGVQGSADGGPSVARFANPAGLAIDGAGNLYVADNGNNTIRKVSATGQVTTLAGVAGTAGSADSAPGVSATFSSPTGVAVDKNGTLYVTDGQVATADFGSFLNKVRVIAPVGQVSTLKFLGIVPLNVSGIAIDSALDIYINGGPDPNVHFGPRPPSGLYKLGPSGHYLGPSSSIVSLDNQGNLYTNFLNSIRKITPQGDIVKLAGPDYPAGDQTSVDPQAGAVDGVGTAARFQIEKSLDATAPRASIAVDSVGNVYLSDLYNHTIRKITSAGLVTTIAGKAGVPGLQLGSLPGLLNRPAGLVLKDDKTLFVTTDNVILRIDLQ